MGQVGAVGDLATQHRFARPQCETCGIRVVGRAVLDPQANGQLARIADCETKLSEQRHVEGFKATVQAGIERQGKAGERIEKLTLVDGHEPFFEFEKIEPGQPLCRIIEQPGAICRCNANFLAHRFALTVVQRNEVESEWRPGLRIAPVGIEGKIDVRIGNGCDRGQ